MFRPGIATIIALTLGLQAAPAVFHQLEIRLAEPGAGDGLTPAMVQGSGARVFLHGDVLATQADVRRATTIETNGRTAVQVEFNPAAAERLVNATQGHIGKPLVFLLDGRVIAAPVLRAAVNPANIIAGTFTRAEAETIAAAMIPAAGVVRPRATVRPLPVHAAESSGVEGIVAMQVLVNADGTIASVAVKESLDAALDAAAVEALERWRFTPGTKNGVPVQMELTIWFEFKLS